MNDKNLVADEFLHRKRCMQISYLCKKIFLDYNSLLKMRLRILSLKISGKSVTIFIYLIGRIDLVMKTTNFKKAERGLMGNKSSEFFGLYPSIHGRLYSYILVMVHNRTVADDLLQETATILWEKFDQFQEGTNFSAWAFSIARNKIFEYLRENQKTKKLFSTDFYERLSHLAEESSNECSARIDALEECLKKLKNSDQKLIKLRYKDNVSIKDISLKTGKSISTLYQHISIILGLLRICISRSLTSQE